MSDNDDFSSLFDDDEDNKKENTGPAPEKEENFSSLDNELTSFFDEEAGKSDDDIDFFGDDEENNPAGEELLSHSEPEPAGAPVEEEPSAVKKRTSQDFEPDMDALLITAQSPMIIEGIKRLTEKNFTGASLNVFSEAIKGVDLYIKILERNPNNYRKLSQVFNSDEDCKEVEKTAFNLYKLKYKDEPSSDDHIIRAYEMLREGLKVGYKKVLISKSMAEIKKYFLQSGGLDEYVITDLYHKNDPKFKKEIANLNQLLKLSINLIKSGNGEIAKGMKGKDLNIYIVKTSELLSYYCYLSGNMKGAKHYKRINDNHKNYFVIR